MSKDKQTLQSLVTSIRQNIQTFEDGASGHVADEVVLVVGSTKSGKSTFMNMIAGRQMEVFKEKGSFRVDVAGSKDPTTGEVLKDDNGKPIRSYAGVIVSEGFESIKIGHQADSTTKLPNYVTVGDKQFWDCPGFGDTRSSDVEISNMYYIRHILKHATAAGRGGVKFVLVQDHDGTESSKSKSFKDAINTICRIFPPIEVSQEQPKALILSPTLLERLIDSTTFVFTKVRTQEMTSADYLSNTLARATPELSDTEPNSIEDALYVAFLHQMKQMHDNDPARIKHIKIPQAYRGMDLQEFQTPIDAIMPQMLNPEAPSIKDSVPNLVVDATAMDVLKELVDFYKIEFKAECTDVLKTQLTEIFKSMPEGAAAKQIHKMFDALPKNKAAFERGGATEISSNLLATLKTLSKDEAYTQTLSDIYKTLDMLKFCNDIIAGTLCGADFTQITEACRMAATTYISEEENRQMQLFNTQSREYYEEQEGKYLAAKVVAVPLMLVGGIMVALLDFDGKGKDVQDEAVGILTSFYHKVYGKLSKPSQSDGYQFSELKQMAEAILSGESPDV